jgi:hypothetical protein
VADASGVKRLCLSLAVLSLALPAAAVAQGPPSPGGSAPLARAVAAALCAGELRELGHDAFRAKYPSRVACLDAQAGRAAQILADCKAAGDPRACLRKALGVHGEAPLGPGGRGRPLVRLVAAGLCRAEAKSLGREAFRAKYAKPGACLRAKATQAAALVEDAQTQCASVQPKARCVLAALAKALGLPSHAPRS